MHSFLGKYIGIICAASLLTGALIVRSNSFRRWRSETKLRQATSALEESGLHFRESAAALGISHRYFGPKLTEALEPEDMHVVGGGIAVADVNRDGFLDFYATSAGPGSLNALYLNNQGAGFRNVAGEWHVEAMNGTVEKANVNPFLPPDRHSFASLFPLFLDVDHDGWPDLLVAGVGGVKLFLNRHDRFDDVTQVSGLLISPNAQSLVPLDYNRDGFTDLYVVRYFGPRNLFENTDGDAWVNSSFDATNGGENSLYRNNGDGTFTDVSHDVGGRDHHWSLDAASGDFFGDGGTEILVSNDFGPDVLYRLTDGKFVDISSRLGGPDRRLGMGVSMGFLDESPLPFLHVSNAFHPLYRHEGNFLWHFGSDGSGHDEALERRTNNCLWAWGAAFGDFDLDGDQDLYVANGFISGEQPQEMPAGIFIEPASGQSDASFRMGTLQGLPGAVMQRGSVFSGMFNADAKLGKLSFAGYERDCVFLNHGGDFSDVAPLVGVERSWDGRAVASIDFNNDGALDLLVSTRNQGLQFLRNEIQPRANWIGFELTDVHGNRFVTHAAAALRQAGRSFFRQSTGGKSGFLAASDPRLHFGLPNEAAVSLELTWPSGRLSSFSGLTPGRYYSICEGKALGDPSCGT